jgi:hypothetical protein
VRSQEVFDVGVDVRADQVPIVCYFIARRVSHETRGRRWMDTAVIALRGGLVASEVVGWSG